MTVVKKKVLLHQKGISEAGLLLTDTKGNPAWQQKGSGGIFHTKCTRGESGIGFVVKIHTAASLNDESGNEKYFAR